MKEINYIQTKQINQKTGIFKNQYGNIYYLLKGKPHRDDGPAVIWKSGSKMWYYFGIRAMTEEQFYNPQWRRKIEIKECL